jgi:spore coat protein U-like protein
MKGPRSHLGWLLSACAGALLGHAATSHAGPAVDASEVRCLVQSARLNFGRIHLKQPQRVAGEGEAVVACQNTSHDVRRVELSLSFPTIGPATGFLQSGRGTLAVAFYRDAQYSWRWGDDRNGADALRVTLELGPDERRQLRIPVYALLNRARDAPAGTYMTHIPVTLTTLPK